jgi:hypothetical protein
VTAVALSDAVLALCALAGIAVAARRSGPRLTRLALVLGWSALAVAAALGALRYGTDAAELRSLHRAASLFAGLVGLPAVAVGILLALRTPSPATVRWLAASPVLPVLVASAGPAAGRLAGALLVLVLAVVIAATPALPRVSRAAALAGLVAVVAAGVFARGVPASEANVIGLHYALAGLQLAWLIAWLKARQHPQEPVAAAPAH